VVGQSPAGVVFGKGSGIDSVKWGLRKLGVNFNEEEAMRVVAAVKEFSLQRKRLLTDEEFRSVVSATLPGKAVGSGRAAD
jgi:isopropylmalate/homocitrate/citramalate synthase